MLICLCWTLPLHDATHHAKYAMLTGGYPLRRTYALLHGAAAGVEAHTKVGTNGDGDGDGHSIYRPAHP